MIEANHFKPTSYSWPEIYIIDGEQQHDLADAVVEYDRLLKTYGELGYEKIIPLKVGVSQRADFVLHNLR